MPNPNLIHIWIGFLEQDITIHRANPAALSAFLDLLFTVHTLPDTVRGLPGTVMTSSMLSHIQLYLHPARSTFRYPCTCYNHEWDGEMLTLGRARTVYFQANLMLNTQSKEKMANEIQVLSPWFAVMDTAVTFVV